MKVAFSADYQRMFFTVDSADEVPVLQALAATLPFDKGMENGAVVCPNAKDELDGSNRIDDGILEIIKMPAQ